MVVAMRILAAAAAVAALCALVAAQEVEDHTFRPPFQDFDNNFGTRKLAKWMIGGSAVLNENFLRLTPDRAVRRGCRAAGSVSRMCRRRMLQPYGAAAVAGCCAPCAYPAWVVWLAVLASSPYPVACAMRGGSVGSDTRPHVVSVLPEQAWLRVAH